MATTSPTGATSGAASTGVVCDFLCDDSPKPDCDPFAQDCPEGQKSLVHGPADGAGGQVQPICGDRGGRPAGAFSAVNPPISLAILLQRCKLGPAAPPSGPGTTAPTADNPPPAARGLLAAGAAGHASADATARAGAAPTVASPRGRMRVLEVVSDPDAIARILHGARAPPAPHPPGQLLLLP